MVKLDELMAFLTEYMGDAGDNDPHMANGLQVRGREAISVLATGVSASLEWFKLAIERKADALLVHHSINAPAGILLDKIFVQRVQFLLEHNLSLIGYHYLLDNHLQVGHSAQIIRKLGAEPIRLHEEGWGWYGEFSQPVEIERVVADCERLFERKGIRYLFGPPRIRHLCVLTGKGAPYASDMELLLRNGVDLFITGEAHEWNRELFREAGMHFIAGGHYQTERFGLWALGEVIGEKFDIQVEFVDLPNEI